MKRISSKQLKGKFIAPFKTLQNFEFGEGNPFYIKIENLKYFIFLKHISPAYFKNSPDITRIQLPYSNHFQKIVEKKNIPLIVLGYDSENDTMVTWDPNKIRERLNQKSNISLYSRASDQAKATSNLFWHGYLTNGDKFVVFKRINVISFFANLFSLFKFDQIQELDFNHSKNKGSLNLNESQIQGVLDFLEPGVTYSLISLLKSNNILQAVELFSNFYHSQGKSLSFNESFKIVNTLHQIINNE